MEATVSLRTRRDNSTRHLLTAHPDLFFDFESLAIFILAVPKYYLVHDTIFATYPRATESVCGYVEAVLLFPHIPAGIKEKREFECA